MKFQVKDLEYSYDALEPYIDAETMKIHHGKHYAGYTNKLNDAITGTEFEGMSIEDILQKGFENKALRNNGGGYYNHSLFWKIMSPNGGGEPQGSLADAIKSAYGSFEQFKDEFSKAAGGQFGSGWAWLCKKDDGSVQVCATPNQDNTLMPGVGCGGFPLMGIDVWEHAYYLHYQNRRPDYITAFFNVINWEEVQKRYES